MGSLGAHRAASCVVCAFAALLLASNPAAGLRTGSLHALAAPFLAALGPGDNHSHKCKPSQVHLAVTGRPEEMRVMWKTHSRSCPTKVHYGEGIMDDANFARNAALLQNVLGSVKSYSPSDMCASPARDYKYAPLILHDVVLSGLTPRRWYSYKVHGGRVLRFQAPPPPGWKEGFQFLVYGDMGDPHHRQAKAPGAGATAKYVHRDVEAGADMVLHVGDIAYANGRGGVWDSFMDAIEPSSSRVPYMVAVGNHEYTYKRKGGDHSPDPSGSTGYNPDWANFGNDSGGECGVTVAARFSMPGTVFQAQSPQNGSVFSSTSSGSTGSSSSRDSVASAGAAAATAGSAAQADIGSADSEAGVAAALQPATNSSALGGLQHKHRRPANPPFWYSFDYGAVHFVVVSSEHDLHKHSQQYRWLKRDLQLADRCVTPWVVLSMHRPMYVVYPHKSNRRVGEHLQRQIEHLLSKHEVDLVFSGHVHSYARTCNVLAGKCVSMQRGGMTHITLGCGGHRLSDVNHDQPEWLVSTAAKFGYGRVTVSDGYTLKFEYIRTDHGDVHDSYVLQNSRADRRDCFKGSRDSAASQR